MFHTYINNFYIIHIFMFWYNIYIIFTTVQLYNTILLATLTMSSEVTGGKYRSQRNVNSSAVRHLPHHLQTSSKCKQLQLSLFFLGSFTWIQSYLVLFPKHSKSFKILIVVSIITVQFLFDNVTWCGVLFCWMSSFLNCWMFELSLPLLFWIMLIYTFVYNFFVFEACIISFENTLKIKVDRMYVILLLMYWENTKWFYTAATTFCIFSNNGWALHNSFDTFSHFLFSLIFYSICDSILK